MNVQPFLFGDGGPWIAVRDGSDTARDIFNRHYSRRRYRDGRQQRGGPSLLILGPGEKMLLLTPDARAVFGWLKFITMDRQPGVCCSIFRNEGAGRSSDLIRAADALADQRWPGERHFTYVDPRKVASPNPGYCFKRAGWRFCGRTRRGMHILERPAP